MSCCITFFPLYPRQFWFHFQSHYVHLFSLRSLTRQAIVIFTISNATQNAIIWHWSGTMHDLWPFLGGGGVRRYMDFEICWLYWSWPNVSSHSKYLYIDRYIRCVRLGQLTLRSFLKEFLIFIICLPLGNKCFLI